MNIKLLIVCNYNGSQRYIPYLVENLIKAKVNVDILDVYKGRFFNCNSNKVKVITSKYIFYFPIIRKFVNRYFIIKYLKKINSSYYNVINLHYASSKYVQYFFEFKRISKNIILTMWGSDFFRDRIIINTEKQQLFLYTNVDKISFSTNQFLEIFNKTYNYQFNSKLNFIRWGIQGIEEINKIEKKESLITSRNKLYIPENSFIITCGYNASYFQQHLEILKQLMTIKNELPENYIIILPMTYREDKKNYIKVIKSYLNENSLNCIIFDTLMSWQDVARLRRITNIILNFQITDDFSGSIQEHLYCNNITIVGDWLPYQIYDDMGINIERIKIENIGKTLIKIFENYDFYKNKFINNHDLIYNISSWESNLSSWINLYNSNS